MGWGLGAGDRGAQGAEARRQTCGLGLCGTGWGLALGRAVQHGPCPYWCTSTPPGSVQGMLGKKHLEHVLQRLGLMPEGTSLPQAFPEVRACMGARGAAGGAWVPSRQDGPAAVVWWRARYAGAAALPGDGALPLPPPLPPPLCCNLLRPRACVPAAASGCSSGNFTLTWPPHLHTITYTHHHHHTARRRRLTRPSA